MARHARHAPPISPTNDCSILKQRRASNRELSEANLSGAELAGASLSGGDFSQSNLSSADFRNGKFEQCDFSDANFSNAKLDGGYFSQCNFSDANLKGITAQGARFEQCDFPSGVRNTLVGAQFQMCDFDGDDDSDGGAQTAADAGAVPGAPPSPWKQYFRKFSEWETEEQRYVAIEALFGAWAAHAQSPQIFRRQNDRKVEMRATYLGLPVRVECGTDGTFTFAAAAQQRDHVVASFCYEPTFVPEPQMAAWSHGDTVRVFIGKGVFVEGHAGTTYIAANIPSPGNIDQMTSLVSRLAPSALGEIAATMTSENIMWMNVGPGSIELCPRSEVQEMYDPLVSMGRIIHLLGRTTQAFRETTANDPHQVNTTALTAMSLRCRYCNALHMLSQAARCPHCGAPS